MKISPKQLTVFQKEELLKSQNEKCAICGLQEYQFMAKEGRFKPLSLDHCHTTGRIRGYLCSKCNIGLGLFQDDVCRLRAAIKYLFDAQQPKFPWVDDWSYAKRYNKTIDTEQANMVKQKHVKETLDAEQGNMVQCKNDE